MYLHDSTNSMLFFLVEESLYYISKLQKSESGTDYKNHNPDPQSGCKTSKNVPDYLIYSDFTRKQFLKSYDKKRYFSAVLWIRIWIVDCGSGL